VEDNGKQREELGKDMTEEEAKTKWCPHVRFLDLGIEDDQPCNRHADDINGKEAGYNPKYARCIGSACMMWRWKAHYAEESLSNGFCGLAGKP
jgi:hypothetical protein